MTAAGEGVGLEQARQAKRRLGELLGADDRISGIGLSRVGAGYLVKVNLAVPEAAAVVPASLDGVAVRTEVVGTIRPLHAPDPD